MEEDTAPLQEHRRRLFRDIPSLCDPTRLFRVLDRGALRGFFFHIHIDKDHKK